MRQSNEDIYSVTPNFEAVQIENKMTYPLSHKKKKTYREVTNFSELKCYNFFQT